MYVVEPGESDKLRTSIEVRCWHCRALLRASRDDLLVGTPRDHGLMIGVVLDLIIRCPECLAGIIVSEVVDHGIPR